MIQIESVEIDGKDGIMVEFSDGTTAGYVVEELLELRPVRERDHAVKHRARQSNIKIL